jgi:hypothetical protein
MCFIYRNKPDLFQTQILMIDLAEHFLACAEDANEKLRASYYHILKLLMNRGEFDLANVGFDESATILLTGGVGKHISKEMLSKMEVGVKFQALLINILEKVLYKLNLKGCDVDERNFIDNFCAIAYFKIPEFRIKLLDSIKKHDFNQPINEWRGTEWVLEDPISDDKRDKHLLNLFDWEKNFYRFVKVKKPGKINKKIRKADRKIKIIIILFIKFKIFI